MSKAIGQTIKELREQKGYTQDTLAQKLGCSQTTVAEWENRKDRLPSGKLLKDIGKILGVSVDYLLNVSDIENPKIPCYGEVSSREFTWPCAKETEYFIEETRVSDTRRA